MAITVSFVVEYAVREGGSADKHNVDTSLELRRGENEQTPVSRPDGSARAAGTDSIGGFEHRSFDTISPPEHISAALPDYQAGSALQSPAQLRQGSTITADHLSPASITELTRRYEEDGRWAPIWSAGSVSYIAESTVASPAVSLPTPGSIPLASLTCREAFLLQHFARKIAPWIDACDLTLQFEREVPKRAMYTPSILFAVLSLSSRHQAIMLDQSLDEASFYHGQCLHLVIEVLSTAENLYDENLLATVVLLRVYEELDHSTDMHFHLRGTSRLLAAIPDASHSVRNQQAKVLSLLF